MIIILWFVFGFIIGNYAAIKLIDYGAELRGTRLKYILINYLMQDKHCRKYMDERLSIHLRAVNKQEQEKY